MWSVAIYADNLSRVYTLQENMAYLILNLSAGSSSDDLALWIGYDALADFCSCLWRDLKHKLTELDIVVGNALHKAQAKQALMSSHAFGTLLFALANLISQGEDGGDAVGKRHGLEISSAGLLSYNVNMTTLSKSVQEPVLHVKRS